MLKEREKGNRMNQDIVNFLRKLRELIKNGNKRFAYRIYPDGRDYLQVLSEDFNITIDQAWRIIYDLKPQLEYLDEFPEDKKDGWTKVFKLKVNNVDAYIKVKIETKETKELIVCISFHKDF